MSCHSRLLALTAVLATSVAFPAFAQSNFNRIASFPVATNLPADTDAKTATSSEIITATEDGNTLVYSDSPLGAVGFIDITDPKAPKAGGIIKIEGEPTSVTIAGGKVFAGVNTSKSKTEPSGNLSVIDISTKAVVSSCDLGGQPDSITASKDGKFLAIAIENERDEELNDGEIPQLPAGNLKIVPLADGTPDCAAIKTVELTGLSEIAPEDPEPEFVSINDAGEIAVTLQENNHIAIVDAATAKVTSHFSAGTVTLEGIDTKKDGALNFSGKMEDVPREPDTVKWLDNTRLLVANEGDYKGGSRGFTIFNKTGATVYESGPSFEYELAKIGHYPDHRNKKGIEPEGAEVGKFGDDNLLFVASERGSVVGVYQDTGAAPKLLQLLPSGIGPEGLLAIPSRNLFVTANETDLGEDGLARSHVMIYERTEGPASYPTLTSELVDGKPLGWGALSGLTADPTAAGTLYAVSDSVYGNQPSIFTIDVTKTPAVITAKTVITRAGNAAQKLDLEGLAADGEGGFWLANEGDSDKLVPHAILHVDKEGKIDKEIGFPAALLAGQTRFGSEGIAVLGSGDDLTLVVAVQREWKDDPKGQTKLVAYNPAKKEWTAARYPLESAPEGGWVGLSEVVAHDGKLYLIERDNQIGENAKLKAIYTVNIADFKPVKLDGELPVLTKTLVRDLIPDLKSGNGYVVDKVEGFTIDAAGEAYVVTDNDGVDDSSGETWFLKLGKLAATN